MKKKETRFETLITVMRTIEIALSSLTIAERALVLHWFSVVGLLQKDEGE